MQFIFPSGIWLWLIAGALIHLAGQLLTPQGSPLYFPFLWVGFLSMVIGFAWFSLHKDKSDEPINAITIPVVRHVLWAIVAIAALFGAALGGLPGFIFGLVLLPVPIIAWYITHPTIAQARFYERDGEQKKQTPAPQHEEFKDADDVARRIADDIMRKR